MSFFFRLRHFQFQCKCSITSCVSNALHYKFQFARSILGSSHNASIPTKRETQRRERCVRPLNNDSTANEIIMTHYRQYILKAKVDKFLWDLVCFGLTVKGKT